MMVWWCSFLCFCFLCLAYRVRSTLILNTLSHVSASMVDSHPILITSNVSFCTSFWRKATGLMFRFPEGDFAYVFRFRRDRSFSVTMWFVFFPIDVVFFDHDGMIVGVRRSLKPFSHHRSPGKCRGFIEFPAGFIDAHGLQAGSRLRWDADGLYKRSSFSR